MINYSGTWIDSQNEIVLVLCGNYAVMLENRTGIVNNNVAAYLRAALVLFTSPFLPRRASSTMIAAYNKSFK